MPHADLEAQWNDRSDAWADWEPVLEGGFAGVTDLMLACGQVAEGARVLDIACGAGGLAVAAAAKGATVKGADIAERMIAHARKKNAAVEWVVADNEACLSGGPWNVVTCRMGAFFFDDAAAWLTRVYEAMAPGGRIVLGLWVPGSVPICDVPTELAHRIFDIDTPEDAPKPSRYGGPGGWMSMLNSAGFQGIGLRGVDVTNNFDTVDKAMTFLKRMSGDLSELGTEQQIVDYWNQVQLGLPFEGAQLSARAAVIWATRP